MGLESACVVRFSQPVDCFGNTVDEDGVSYDARGRTVDAESYLVGPGGKPKRDAHRDAQYTRELGEVICEAFKRDTVVMATHLVAAAAFARLRSSVGRGDIFALLRHADDVRVPRAELAVDVEQLRDSARAMAERGEIVLSTQVARAGGDSILDAAMRAFAGYHTNAVLEPRGPDLVLADTRLLFYYQNRLAAHGLAYDVLGPKK